ncbi:MAG: FAD-binding oxidoreductase [Synergistaceae bacterium]|jgi:sarcosine oxidase subunit beta|nr:FAD-binding oxidoreductase [Synergistaceae bacterium]
MNSHDVIVVGGGVIGASTAYYLSKRGARVMLVEADVMGSGSSGACDGFVIMQSKAPGPHLRMALASEEMYRTLPEELEYDIEYDGCGGMIIIESPAEFEAMKSFMASQREAGLDVELIGGDEARKLEPALAPHIVGATVSGRDGQVNPMRLVTGYSLAARRLGLKIERRRKVTGFTGSGGKITGIRTSDGDFHTDRVVCCTGVHTPELLAPLGIDLPIKPRRGQLIATEPIERLVSRVMLCARYIAAKYHPELLEGSKDESVRLGVGMALEQSRSGGLLIGATREFVGFNRGATADGARAVAAHAARMIPALKRIRAVRCFAGLRPYTPDGKAFIGAAPGYEGLYVAAGHEGDGIAYAPITGRVMSELVIDGTSKEDIMPFALNRFEKPCEKI